jgi:hypothetical protein
MRLRANELCPIHRSRFCCGREPKEQMRARMKQSGPIRQIPDDKHPRGYRVRRSPSEMRKLTLKKLAEQKGICGWCERSIDDVREATPDHIESRGMGGAWRDDHEDNIRAVHGACNCERGSKPYLTRKEMLRAEKKARQVPA